ncbi:MAG: hypothetical protein M3T96_09950 [Acidobacteriota bacterium]|nr:hypothetical protein [Acidobacteriota bacterium]
MKTLSLLLVLVFTFSCSQRTNQTNANIEITSNSVIPAIRIMPSAIASTTTTKSNPSANAPQLPKEVSQSISEIKKLQKKGFEMQSLRDKNDSQSVEKCGELMKKYQTAAMDFGEKTENLPGRYSGYLSLAAIRLETCVTCGSDAKESCEMVDEDLNEMYRRENK